jgi:hypothetical protein
VLLATRTMTTARLVAAAPTWVSRAPRIAAG